MRVLILDDQQLRHEVFADRHEQDEVHHTFTYDRAIELLRSKPKFDVVYLDHDLQEKATGYDAAKFIAERLPDDRKPGVVVVHTLNSACGDRMVQVLQAGGIPTRLEPFQV